MLSKVQSKVESGGVNMPVEYVTTDDFHIEKYTIKGNMTTMHYHHAYELYYVLEGEREYFIGDSFYSVESGDFVWVPKNMLHKTEGRDTTRFLLHFKEAFLEKYFSPETINKLTSSKPFVFRPEPDHKAKFEELFYEILMEYNKKKIHYEDYNEFLIVQPFFNILFFIFSHNNYYQKDISKPNERMHEIVKYINNNYQDPITIQKIAYDFGITKDHLCHIFPKYMGVTFITYLNTVRIKAACDILKKEKDSILEISNKCGFSSSHYFSKVFKKEKGMSPSEYRSQFKVVSSKSRNKNDMESVDDDL